MTLLTDLETKIGVADANLDLLDSAVNDAPGTFTVKDGTNVPNLRQRLQDAAYAVPVAFASGLTPLDGSFTVTYEGAVYAADPSALPFTTTSTFDPAQWVLVAPVKFDTIADMVSSAAPSRGIGSEWQTRYFKYIELDPSATDPDFVTAGGVKLDYDPGAGPYYPRALFDTNGPLVVAYPSADQNEVLQRGLRKCANGVKRFDFEYYFWRSETTLSRKDYSTGKEVAVIQSAGANVLFPSTGVYSRFRLDDDSGDAADTMQIAFDTSGGPLAWEGLITLRGGQFSRFRSNERAQVRQDLSCFGGVRGFTSEMSSSGKVWVEGFAHWMYVPKVVTNFSSRQYARLRGMYRPRFCLSPWGVFLASSNGSDDSNADIRSDRCGGHGNVEGSNIFGTELGVGYLFCSGLNEIQAGNEDWEDQTIDINANDGAATLSGGVNHPHLAAGHKIAILGAFERTNPNATTTTIPLVARVASIGVGGAITLDSKTLPNITASGLRWFYRPTKVNMFNASVVASVRFYLENYMEGVELQDRARITSPDIKFGGVKMCGMGGAPINTSGRDNVITGEINTTSLDSAGLRACVAYGMIRLTADVVDAGFRMDVGFNVRSTDQFPVAPVIGIDPVDFNTSGRVSRFGTPITGVNVLLNYTDAQVRGSFAADGSLETRNSIDGLGYGEAINLKFDCRVSTQIKNEIVSTTPVVVFDDSNFEANSLYEVFCANGNRNSGDDAVVLTDASGNVAVVRQSGTFVTFSASGTELRAALGAGSQTVGFTVARRLS